MLDKIEKIGNNSLIHHGELNNRVYLMKLDKKEANEVIREINDLARKEKYTKIFCKVPASVAPLFTASGFISESQIPGFFDGTESVFFMSKFLSSDRLLSIETNELNILSELLNNQQKQKPDSENTAKKHTVKRLRREDSERMAAIYQRTFKSYPFPVFNPEYIRNTMKSGVQYYGIEVKGKLVALASAEVNAGDKNAEMTDFATLPEYRGKKYALSILKEMEMNLKKEGIKTVYTIARLRSVGMNLTFLRRNYLFAGTLLKNTNISGEIESMNIYYKHL